MEQERTGFAHFLRVVHVPQIQTVIVVDDGQTLAVSIVSQRHGVRVLSRSRGQLDLAVRIRGGVSGGQEEGKGAELPEAAGSNVHAQVVGFRQSGDEVKRMSIENTHHAICTPNKQQMLAHGQTVGIGGLECKKE